MFNDLILKVKKIIEDKNKKSLTILVLSLFILLLTGASFAYFTAQIQGGTNANINVATGTVDSLMFYESKKASIKADLDTFAKGKGNLTDDAIATAELKANSVTNQVSASYNVFLLIDENDFVYTTDDFTPELIVKIYDPNGNEITDIEGLKKVEGGFDITTRTGGYLIRSDYEIEATDTEANTDDWKAEVTLVNLEHDQRENMAKHLNARLYLTKEKLNSYEIPIINGLNASVTSKTITANLTVNPGTDEVNKYYFAIEEKKSPTAFINDSKVKRLANENKELTWYESDNSYYTFLDLEQETTYIVYSYVENENKIKSVVFETEVTTGDYVLPTIDGLILDSTLNTISVTINTTEGDEKIFKYYYSIDDKEWIEKSSNTHIFEGLNDTTKYKIKVKVEDSKGRYTEYSEEYETVTYINPSITKIEQVDRFYNKVKINVTAEDGTNKISKYAYQVEDASWKEVLTNQFEITDLNESTDYIIKVKAIDSNNRESTIKDITASTRAYELPTISDVTYKATTDSIELNFTATSGDNEVSEVSCSKDGSTWDIALDNKCIYQDLEDNKEYVFLIRAKDAANRYSESYEKIVTTVKYNNPVITNVDYITTYKSIEANITAEGGTNPVNKYFFSINNGDWIEKSTNSHIFSSGITDGKSYNIKSKVTDTKGRESEIISDTVKADDYVLPKINSIRQTEQTLNSMKVSIDVTKGTNNITGYYCSRDGGSTWSSKQTSNVCSFSGLNDTTNYSISIKVEDSDGRTSVINKTFATTTYINPKVSNADVTTVSYNYLETTINGTKGTNNIAKYMCSINGSNWTTVSTNATSTTCRVSGLSESTSYTIQVKIVDSNNRESSITKITKSTRAYNVPKVTSVGVVPSKNSLKITSGASGGDGTISKYYFSKDGGSNWTTGQASSTYTFSNLTPYTQFSVAVKVEDSNGRMSSYYYNNTSDAKTLPDDFTNNTSNVSATYDGTARSITLSIGNATGYTKYYSTSTKLTTSNYKTSGTTTNPTRTSAGVTTVYWCVEKTGFNTLCSSNTITINKATFTNNSTNISKTYNGSASTFTASVTPTSGTTIYYSTSQLTTSNYTSGTTTKIARANAGTTTVYWCAINSNYNTYCSNNTITISKANPSISSATSTISAGSTTNYITYTGEVTPTCSPTSGTYASCSVDTTNKRITFTRKKVGSQSITVSMATGTNYNSFSKTVTVQVAGYTPSLSVTSVAIGTGNSASITYTGDGTPSCGKTSGTYVNCSVSGKTITFTRKSDSSDGSETISISATAGTNYKSLTSTNITISVSAQDICTNGTNLTTCIKSLYTSQGSNGIYYHTTSLANSAGDNSYRYAGADPNNYVCFGSTASPCPDDNLYRIIGVFGNQVKLIKADYATSDLLGTNGDYYDTYAPSETYYKGSQTTIARYYWNALTKDGGTENNNWSESRLNTINLNTNFVKNIGTTWANKIISTNWNIGGYSTNEVPAKTFYDAEKKVTYKAKIGLLTTSDYGYATTSEKWTTNLDRYYDFLLDNWIMLGEEWTITKSTNTNENVLVVWLNPYMGGHAFNFGEVAPISSPVFSGAYLPVRPSFYLNSTITYKNGSGSKTYPIRIN